MQRLIRYSIPAIAAAVALTAHPAPQPVDASSQKSSNSSLNQQKNISVQQKNQKSTFDPQRVSDGELRKNVTDLNKASTFMGMSVQNLQNDKLGTVKDLVFDPSNGKISYAVVSVGGFLGVGDKLIAVPVTSLRAQPGQNHLVLNMTKDELSSAPGLARNNWPRLDDPALGAPAGSQQESATSPHHSSEPATPPTTSPPSQTSGSSDEHPGGSPAAGSSGASSGTVSGSTTSPSSPSDKDHAEQVGSSKDASETSSDPSPVSDSPGAKDSSGQPASNESSKSESSK